MRILHFIPSMGGGGAERQLVYLAKEAVKRGHEVHVALLYGGPNLDQLRATGARIHIAGFGTHHDPRVYWSWRSIVRRVQPHVVHTWLLYCDLVGGLVARTHRVPWLLSERANSVAYAAFPFRRRARERLARGATAVISNSPSGDIYWRDVLQGHVRRYVIANAIPIEVYQSKPAERRVVGADPEEKLILVVGRLEEGKNIATLVRAAARAAETCKLRLLVCGEGPLRGELEKARHPRLRVTFRGYEKSIWPIMKMVDLMASLSLFEGQPNAVMEAMASRCPLLLSDIPEHRALVSDDAAHWVAPRAESDIASGILEILNDRAATQLRTERAYQASFKFTPEAMAAGYDRIYSELRLALDVQVSRTPQRDIPHVV